MADATMSNVLKKSGRDIQASWTRDLANVLPTGKGRITNMELEQQTAEFLKLLTAVVNDAKASDIASQ